jgi:hypothetical protein
MKFSRYDLQDMLPNILVTSVVILVLLFITYGFYLGFNQNEACYKACKQYRMYDCNSERVLCGTDTEDTVKVIKLK